MKNIKFNLLTIVLIMALFIIPIQVTPILADDIYPILKIGIITDVHIGERGSATRFSDFVTTMNIWKPDFIVDLGDAITGFGNGDNYTGKVDLDRYRAISANLTMQIYRVPGNHDVDTISIAEWIAHTGMPSDQYSFINNGLKFIAINTQRPSNEVLSYLASALSANTTNIIFGHKPLISQKEPTWVMPNSDNVISVLEASDNVSMCFFGHLHLNEYYERNGIKYFTLDSSNFIPNDSYSALTIYSDGGIWLYGYGKQVNYGIRPESDNTSLPPPAYHSQPPPPPPPAPEAPTYYPLGDVGSGGGGVSVVGNKRTTSVYSSISSNGTVWEELEIQSLDAKLNMIIPMRSVMKQKNGNKIYAVSVETLKEAPSGNITSKAYKITPDSVVFDFPIPLSIAYSDNVSDNLSIANWDAEKKEWVALESKVDNVKHIVSADIMHFSTYALINEAKVDEVIIPKSDIVQLTDETNQFDYRLTWAWFWNYLIR